MKYDLEERTLNFAKRVRLFTRSLPKTLDFVEDVKQLIRSSGSVGANYVEANEALSKKDFIMRIKIAKKEARESSYWLSLFDGSGFNSELNKERGLLTKEAGELISILGAILRNSV